MAVDDLDIYRTAKLLIDQHGNEATIHAAIKELKREEPAAVERRH